MNPSFFFRLFRVWALLGAAALAISVLSELVFHHIMGGSFDTDLFRYSALAFCGVLWVWGMLNLIGSRLLAKIDSNKERPFIKFSGLASLCTGAVIGVIGTLALIAFAAFQVYVYAGNAMGSQIL